TYFGRRPVRVCEHSGLETGTLSVAMLKRAAAVDVPTVAARLLSTRPATRHPRIEGLEGVADARLRSLSERPLPLQVDGDRIGDFTDVEFAASPRSLAVVA
ncbi:MAG: hypothetical protein M3133_04900, partial [Actinomycetota bacterium]|nr:hypothetical protein [Actinomycetota bacterium]